MSARIVGHPDTGPETAFEEVSPDQSGEGALTSCGAENSKPGISAWPRQSALPIWPDIVREEPSPLLPDGVNPRFGDFSLIWIASGRHLR